MEKIFKRDFSELQGIFRRPEPINIFARQRMRELNRLFEGLSRYNCEPSCKQCCYGSILMSYTEFSAITLYLQENWAAKQVQELIEQRVGQKKDDGTLLCPFLHPEKEREHCSIYQVRPLICRVFGTTAAPCNERIEPVSLDDAVFHLGYHLLYYSGRQFIALNLDAKMALFEAPFALWCLADNSEADRRLLSFYLEHNGDSLGAVLFDRERNEFFTLRRGKRIAFSNARDKGREKNGNDA